MAPQNHATREPESVNVAERAAVGAAEPAEGGDTSSDTSPAPETLEWHALVKLLSPPGFSGQLARHSECVERSDTLIRLRLDHNVVSLNTPAVCEQLQAVLREGLHNPALVLEVDAGAIETQTVAEASQQAVRDAQDAAEAAIHADPTVQELLRAFDGRIRPNTIKPLDANPPTPRQ